VNVNEFIATATWLWKLWRWTQ